MVTAASPWSKSRRKSRNMPVAKSAPANAPTREKLTSTPTDAADAPYCALAAPGRNDLYAFNEDDPGNYHQRLDLERQLRTLLRLLKFPSNLHATIHSRNCRSTALLKRVTEMMM